MRKQTYQRTPLDIFFISGVSLGVPPWPGDLIKSKALLLHPVHVRRLGAEYEKPQNKADETKEFLYRKRTIWVNLVVLFRLLLMAQHLSFDHDNFWKFVRLKWSIGANAGDIKYLVDEYADRRRVYLSNRSIQRHHVDILTNLIDAWVSREGDLPLPKWPRREDITAEWERLSDEWDRLVQHGDYLSLIDNDNPPILGAFPGDRGSLAHFRIKGEGSRSRSQSTGLDRDHSSNRTSQRFEERNLFVAPHPRNNDPHAPPSPPSQPLTPNAMELAVDELIESEGHSAHKRKPHPDQLDPTPTKRRCLEDDLPSPWTKAPGSAFETMGEEEESPYSPVGHNLGTPQTRGTADFRADATHSGLGSGPTEKHTSHQLVAMIDETTSHLQDLASRHDDSLDSLEQRAGEHRDNLQYLEEKAGEHGIQHLDLDTRTDDHQAKVASLESKTTRHEERVGSFETRTGQDLSSLSSLELRTNAHEKKLNILEAMSDHHKEQLCSLEARTGKQETTLSFLKTKVGEHSTQFHRVNGLQNTSSDQSQQLRAHQKQIDDHDWRLDNHQNRLGDYHRRLSDHHKQIDAHEMLLQFLQDKAAGDKNMLQSLQEPKAKSSQLQTTIGNYQSELETLKLRLAKSEEMTSHLNKDSVRSAAFTMLSSKVNGSLGKLDSMGKTVAQLATDSNAKLGEHESILNSLRASTAELDKTNGDSKTMFESLEAKVGQQREQCQTLVETVDGIKNTNTQFNTTVQSLETNFGKYRDQLDSLNIVVNGLEKTASGSANAENPEAAFGVHKDQFNALQKAVDDFNRTTVEHDENIRAVQEQVRLIQESGDLSRDVQKAHNDLTVFTASQCQTALEKLDTVAADLSSLREQTASYRQTTEQVEENQTQHEETDTHTAGKRLLSTMDSIRTIQKGQKEQLDRHRKLENRFKIVDDHVSRADASAKTMTKTLKGVQYRQQELAEEVDDRLATTSKVLTSVMTNLQSLQKSMQESVNVRLSKLESGSKDQCITSPSVEERLARMEDAIQTNSTLIGNCRTLVEVSKTSLDQQFSTLGNRVSLLEQRLSRRMAEQEKAQATRMERLEAELEQLKGTTRQQHRG